jgi:hypothetical protein
MTIAEAISQVNALKPNTYEQSIKVKWLSDLDARIKTQVIDQHKGNVYVFFYGYDENDMDAKLLVSAPYDEMYLHWLSAMIDYHNSDDDRYNNDIILFNNAYEGYKNHYTRTHMPLSNGGTFTF